jgi:organic hydroperoxide reductase OsmC/OhrA
MQPYPHLYSATAVGERIGPTRITSPDLPQLESAPPPEFGGPGGIWSPETLLVGAIADCFLLTFRSVARAAGLDWRRLACQVEGTLERAEGRARFTRFKICPRLAVSSEADIVRARGLLQRTEQDCLVSNSLSGRRTLEAEVYVDVDVDVDPNEDDRHDRTAAALA